MGKVYELPGNTNPAKERMTLDQVRKYDDENHRLILDESELYRLEDPQAAGVFHWEAWRRCMKHLGVTAIENFWKSVNLRELHSFATQLKLAQAMNRGNEEMLEKGIQVEEATPRKLLQMTVNPEAWKLGKYVYYKGDIVYFISNPMEKRRRRGLIYIAGQVDYCVRTNAPKT